MQLKRRRRPLPASWRASSRQEIIDQFISLPIQTRCLLLSTSDLEWSKVVTTMAAHIAKRRRGARHCRILFTVEPPSCENGEQLNQCKAKAGKGQRLDIRRGAFVSVDPPPLDDLGVSIAFGEAAGCELLLSGTRVCGTTITFSEALLSDVGALVRALDAVSWGGFLRHSTTSSSSICSAASPWARTPWLARMDRCTLGAFLANRIEMTLRWMFGSRKEGEGIAAHSVGVNGMEAAVSSEFTARRHRLQAILQPAGDNNVDVATVALGCSRATTDVLQGPRGLIEDALFQSGLLGGWSSLSALPRWRYWDMDWVSGWPPDPILALRAMLEVCDGKGVSTCGVGEDNVNRCIGTDMLDKLLSLPLYGTNKLEGLIWRKAADVIEERAAIGREKAAKEAEAELLATSSVDLKNGSAIAAHRGGGSRSCAKKRAKSRAQKRRRNEKSIITPGTIQENSMVVCSSERDGPPSPPALQRWHSAVGLDPSARAAAERCTQIHVAVHNILSSVIATAVSIAIAREKPIEKEEPIVVVASPVPASVPPISKANDREPPVALLLEMSRPKFLAPVVEDFAPDLDEADTLWNAELSPMSAAGAATVAGVLDESEEYSWKNQHHLLVEPTSAIATAEASALWQPQTQGCLWVATPLPLPLSSPHGSIGATRFGAIGSNRLNSGVCTPVTGGNAWAIPDRVLTPSPATIVSSPLLVDSETKKVDETELLPDIVAEVVEPELIQAADIVEDIVLETREESSPEIDTSAPCITQDGETAVTIPPLVDVVDVPVLVPTEATILEHIEEEVEVESDFVIGEIAPLEPIIEGEAATESVEICPTYQDNGAVLESNVEGPAFVSINTCEAADILPSHLLSVVSAEHIDANTAPLSSTTVNTSGRKCSEAPLSTVTTPSPLAPKSSKSCTSRTGFPPPRPVFQPPTLDSLLTTTNGAGAAMSAPPSPAFAAASDGGDSGSSPVPYHPLVSPPADMGRGSLQAGLLERAQATPNEMRLWRIRRGGCFLADEDEPIDENSVLRDACLRLESEVAKLRNVVAVSAHAGPPLRPPPPPSIPVAVSMAEAVNARPPPPPRQMSFVQVSSQQQQHHVAWEVMSDDGRGPLWQRQAPPPFSMTPQPAAFNGASYGANQGTSYMYLIPEQCSTAQSCYGFGDRGGSGSGGGGGEQPQVWPMTPQGGNTGQPYISNNGVYNSSGMVGMDMNNMGVGGIADDDYHTLQDRLEVWERGLGPPRHPSRSGGTMLRSRLCEALHSFLLYVAGEERRRFDAKWVAYHRCRMVVRSLWPRAQANLYGSFVTGLGLPWSDLDLVIWLPKVRKDAPALTPGPLEGRNAIKETWQQELARSLSGQPWVDRDSIKIISHTAVPVIKLTTQCGIGWGSTGMATTGSSRSQTKEQQEKVQPLPPVLMDISFEGQRHNGQAANRLVLSLMAEHAALRPLVLVLKQFLKERGLCVSYTGGLSSYALVLLIARYLQEQSSGMDIGSLLWGFLDFFGNEFDPRTTGISVSRSCYFSRLPTAAATWPLPPHVQPQVTPTLSTGMGGTAYFSPHTSPAPLYPHRRGSIHHAGSNGGGGYGGGGRQNEQVPPGGAGTPFGVPYRFDPLFIEDPLCLGNNVGRNCFRIYQIKKSWSDAHAALERAMDANGSDPMQLLRSIILPFPSPGGG